MAQLAIKGHATRGQEVIQLLEMLGGENKYYAQGNCTEVLYFIYDNKGIQYLMKSDARTDLMKVFTLEEFEEEFPYKVGDDVITKSNNVYKINDIMWDNKEIVYSLTDGNSITCWYNTAELRPYKEENIEEVYAYNEINCYHQDFGDKVRIRLGDDFEIKVEDKITYIVKKQSQYPKNYEECESSGISSNPVIVAMAQGVSMYSFARLIVIRNTYWEIAGKKMGLGKPWEPDWRNYEEQKYCIRTDKGKITLSEAVTGNKILAFPTPEMRDAFYENFKKEIEMCKELL